MPLIKHGHKVLRLTALATVCMALISITAITADITKQMVGIVLTITLMGGYNIWLGGLSFRLRDIMLGKLHRFFTRGFLLGFRGSGLEGLLALGLLDTYLVVRLDVLREFLYQLLLGTCLLPILSTHIWTKASQVFRRLSLLDAVEILLSVGFVIVPALHDLLSSLCRHKLGPGL